MELSTVTNPICGNNVEDYGCDFGGEYENENDHDHDHDFLATHRKKVRTNTVDTEVSLAGDDFHEGQSNTTTTTSTSTGRRRFDALNEIASYDDDECLIWSAESSLSATSSSTPDPSEMGKMQGAQSRKEKESQLQKQKQQQQQHLQLQLQLQLLAPIPPQTRVTGEALGRCVGNNAVDGTESSGSGSGSRFRNRNRNRNRNRTPMGSPKIRGKREPTKGLSSSSSSSKSAGKRLGRVASRIFPPRPKYLQC